MGAIDNTNLTNLNRDSDTTGFTPGVSFVYDATAKEIDFTDASTFPDGVSLKKTHVRVFDKSGNEVRGVINNPDGSESPGQRTTTVDVSTLDASRQLDITATVIADDDKLIADGSAINIGASGTVGRWDKQKNA